MTEPVLKLTGIVKAFSGMVALNKVDFELAPGEIRALMGKNGAGKSTLVRIISGAMRPEMGTMEASGRPVHFSTPREATEAGIATVHQELTIIPGLSIAENITLGHWPASRGILNGRKAIEVAREALALLGEDIDPAMPAGEISIAKQQIVEIARALALKPKVLILDEPTSSLPAHEVEALLSLVRRLGKSGVSVIYVSHRMDEIARVADSVTVLRDGRLIDTLDIASAPIARIAQLMVGEGVEISGREDLAPAGEAVVLDVAGLDAGPRVQSVSLQVRKGEILGIAGLLGSGRTELLRVLAGIDRHSSGSIALHDKPIGGRSVREMLGHGIALVPEDRKVEGLVLGMPIAQNLSMSALSRVSSAGVLSRGRESELARDSRTQLDIKAADLDLPVETLSGGNQQKVVIGRCLNAEVEVLLLDEPTRGVDVQAKQQIYALVKALAAEGKAIIFVSSEYEELLLLCHRVVVMAEGQIVEAFDPDTVRMDGLMTRLLAANDALKAQEAPLLSREA